MLSKKMRVRDNLKQTLREGLLRKPSLKKALLRKAFTCNLLKFASLTRTHFN